MNEPSVKHTQDLSRTPPGEGDISSYKRKKGNSPPLERNSPPHKLARNERPQNFETLDGASDTPPSLRIKQFSDQFSILEPKGEKNTTTDSPILSSSGTDSSDPEKASSSGGDDTPSRGENEHSQDEENMKSSSAKDPVQPQDESRHIAHHHYHDHHHHHHHHPQDSHGSWRDASHWDQSQNYRGSIAAFLNPSNEQPARSSTGQTIDANRKNNNENTSRLGGNALERVVTVTNMTTKDSAEIPLPSSLEHLDFMIRKSFPDLIQDDDDDLDVYKVRSHGKVRVVFTETITHGDTLYFEIKRKHDSTPSALASFKNISQTLPRPELHRKMSTPTMVPWSGQLPSINHLINDSTGLLKLSGKVHFQDYQPLRRSLDIPPQVEKSPLTTELPSPAISESNASSSEDDDDNDDAKATKRAGRNSKAQRMKRSNSSQDTVSIFQPVMIGKRTLTRDDLLQPQAEVAKLYGMGKSTFAKKWRKICVDQFGEPRRWPQRNLTSNQRLLGQQEEDAISCLQTINQPRVSNTSSDPALNLSQPKLSPREQASKTGS